MDIQVSDNWKKTYPGAAVGLMTSEGVVNPRSHPALDRQKATVEAQVRAAYAGLDRTALKAVPALAAYGAYYRRFKKTYHVLLQLESVASKGQSIPRVSALVEAMFLAELETLLLTAGHDLDNVQTPIRLDIAEGSEQYTRLNGETQQLKAGDMYIADDQGVLSSVIYGPDRRTRLQKNTRRALYTTYAPPGIGEEAVRNNLLRIQDNIVRFAPDARIGALEVFTSG